MFGFKWGRKRRKLGGFVLLMFGLGMALGLLLCAWAFVVAASIIIAGFWMMFL
ncbi:MAG: hypothetical protein FWE92_02310 [Defluviitaleaceae bacterium]|nr:hypothetical protein [Defluviitaleaceae bacterium]